MPSGLPGRTTKMVQMSALCAIVKMGGLLQYGWSDRPSHSSGPTRLNNDLPSKPSQESIQRAGQLKEPFDNFKVRYYILTSSCKGAVSVLFATDRFHSTHSNVRTTVLPRTTRKYYTWRMIASEDFVSGAKHLIGQSFATVSCLKAHMFGCLALTCKTFSQILVVA